MVLIENVCSFMKNIISQDSNPVQIDSKKSFTVYNGWNPVNRYRNNQYEWNKKEIAQKFNDEKKIIMRYIEQMILDGVNIE